MRVLLIIAAVLLAVAIGLTVYLLTLGPVKMDLGTIVIQEVTEDDPRWDCRTMGNGICG